MISLLKKSVLFLPILACWVPFAAAEPALKLETLPKEELLPIEKNCGCMMFPRGGPLTKENVLFLIESADGPVLMRVGGKTRSLTSIPNPKGPGKKIYVNEYRGQGIQVKIESRSVSYQKFCSAYPEPPTEGTCFLGTLKASSAQGTAQQEIVEICGC